MVITLISKESYKITKKYKAPTNNDVQLQHMRCLITGNLSKFYVDCNFPYFTNVQLEQKSQELQEFFIKNFCNDPNYNFFNNNENLGFRIARFYDLSSEGIKFVHSVLFEFIMKEALLDYNDTNIIDYIIKKLDNKVSIILDTYIVTAKSYITLIIFILL